jgi:proteasome accessory factor B
VVITRTSGDLASEVLSFGPDAYVVEPAQLREAVVARLDEVLA